MSDTNLRDFYERYIEALNAHEFDRMDEFIHESIVLHSEPSSRAAVVAQLNSITDAVPDFHWETQELAIGLTQSGSANAEPDASGMPALPAQGVGKVDHPVRRAGTVSLIM